MPSLLPQGKQQYLTSAGAPLVGGKVYTYSPGTSTPKTTYSDAAGSSANANPVVLDSRGEATIFWNGSYKVVLKDASDVTIWTQDNVGVTSDLPSFCYNLSANLTSWTSGATILFDQAAFTQIGGSNYNPATGTFTAPVAGVYMFIVQLNFTNTTGGTVTYTASLVTTGKTFSQNFEAPSAASNTAGGNATILQYMAAGDTAKVTLAPASVTNLTLVGSSTPTTFFAGRLIG